MKQGLSKARKALYERVKGYTSQEPPYSAAYMMQIEGRSPADMKAAIDESLTTAEFIAWRNATYQYRPDTPYGLSTMSLPTRAELAVILFEARQKYSGDKLQPLIGMLRPQQERAMKPPFNFDWKLSQIDRLLNLMGKDPTELYNGQLT